MQSELKYCYVSVDEPKWAIQQAVVKLIIGTNIDIGIN